MTEKEQLNAFGIVRCDKRGAYVEPVTGEEEKTLKIYAAIFHNQGEMVKLKVDGKTRYYRLKGKKPEKSTRRAR